MRVTDIVFQWQVTREMQEGVDIGSESDDYRLIVVGYSGMQVATNIGNKRNEYRHRVVAYSGDAGRY